MENKNIEEINLLDFNLCRYPECDCGSNIKIGAEREVMKKIISFLIKNFKINNLRKKDGRL